MEMAFLSLQLVARPWILALHDVVFAEIRSLFYKCKGKTLSLEQSTASFEQILTLFHLMNIQRNSTIKKLQLKKLLPCNTSQI